MPDPMTPERLADRRKEIEAEHVERRYFYGAECSCGECLPCVVLADELAWLDEVERLRAELATVLKNYEILQGTAIRLEGERDEARVAVAEEQRIADERRTALLEERDQARHDLAEAEAERDDARDAETAARRNYASAENENVSLRARAEKAEEERDAAHEQVKDTERAVHGFFADADQRGVHLDGMTVDELCDAVMAAIRKGPGR